MRLLNVTIAVVVLFALLLTNAEASNKQVGGLIIGGGTGAIVGNAVGKDVESTIIGATVGGVLGYAIGNELDRHHGSVNNYTAVVRHSQSHYRQPRSSFKNHNRQYNYRKKGHRDYPSYQPYGRKCRKVITVKKQRHKTKRVVSTTCGNNYRNNKKNNNSGHRYNDRHYR